MNRSAKLSRTTRRLSATIEKTSRTVAVAESAFTATLRRLDGERRGSGHADPTSSSALELLQRLDAVDRALEESVDQIAEIEADLYRTVVRNLGEWLPARPASAIRKTPANPCANDACPDPAAPGRSECQACAKYRHRTGQDRPRDVIDAAIDRKIGR